MTTLETSWAIVTQSGNLNFLEPSGNLRPVMVLLYPSFTVNSLKMTSNEAVPFFLHKFISVVCQNMIVR